MLTIVELFGLPGAGKTTVANIAATDSGVLTRKALSAAWAKQPMFRQAAYVVRGLADFDQLILAARLARASRGQGAESFRQLLRLLAKSHWLRSHEGTLLLDQGFLQDLWSILYSASCAPPDPQILSPLVKALYRGSETKIVLVEIDPQTAAKRIRERTHGHSRFDLLRGAHLLEALIRGVKVQRAIVDASKMAGLEVERIDGSAPVNALATELRLHSRSVFDVMDERVGIFAA